eukprot:scaffold4586_cov66-Phaeocystis_antarctica.AAC.1
MAGPAEPGEHGSARLSQDSGECDHEQDAYQGEGEPPTVRQLPAALGGGGMGGGQDAGASGAGAHARAVRFAAMAEEVVLLQV